MKINLLLFCFAMASTSGLAQSVGVVVGWKLGHPPGIDTRNDQITRWPADLGPIPTDAQIAAWREEYRAAQEDQAAEEAIDLDARATARALEELVAVLIEERVIPRAKVPARVLERVNRRRARKGRPAL